MKPIQRLGLVLLSASLLVLATASAAAQGLEEPLVDKAEDEVGQAQEDPVGYASDQATEEGLAEDARWGVAYACFARHEVSDASGLPEEPDLEACEDYEEAIGIEQQDDEEDPVAIADELEDDAVAEVDDYADDALAIVEEVVQDPEDAPNHVLRLLDRTVALIEDVLDHVGDAVDEALGEASRALDALVAGIDGAVTGVADTAGQALAEGLSVEKQAMNALGDAATASGKKAGDIADAAKQGASDASRAVSNGIVEIWDNILGHEPAPSTPRGPDPSLDRVKEAKAPLDDVVCVDCLLETV